MNGRFVVDVTALKLTDEQLQSMERSLQKAMLTQLADWHVTEPEISVFLPEIWPGGLIAHHHEDARHIQEDIGGRFR